MRATLRPASWNVVCLAQLVNAIAPIMTETGGPAADSYSESDPWRARDGLAPVACADALARLAREP